MASAKEQREARRRRILERGTERLAFITGQQPSLKEDAEESVPRRLSASMQMHDSKEGSRIADGIPSVQIEKPDFTSEIFSEREKEGSGTATTSPPQQAKQQSATADTSLRKRLSADAASSEQIKLQEKFLQDSGAGISSPLTSNSLRSKSSRDLVQPILKAMQATDKLRIGAALFLSLMVVIQQVLLVCNTEQLPLILRKLPPQPLFLLFVGELSIIAGAWMWSQQSAGRQAEDKRGPGVTSGHAPLEEQQGIANMLNMVEKVGQVMGLWMLATRICSSIARDASVFLVATVLALSAQHVLAMHLC